MKKILLIVIALISFVCVKAEVNDTNVNIDWIPNVYYNYRKNGLVNWGQFGYIYVNDEIAYCLDIENDITSSTYSSSLDLSSIPLLVQTASYFGYGYEDNNTLKDYMATQQLIWKFMGVDVYFTTQSKGAGSRIDISSNVKKIENLLNSYGWFPGFDIPFDFNIGNEYITHDKNGLMNNNFLIYNTTSNNINYVENGIIIEALEPGYSYFTLERIYEKLGDSIVYYAEGSQKLFKGKELPPLSRDYFYNVKGADLFIKIHDIENNEFLNLENNLFELYDSNNNIVETITSYNDGMIISNNLGYGEYTLKHIQVANGYQKLKDIVIDITDEVNYWDIFLEPITRKIKITKEYGNSKIKDIHKDANKVFEIYLKDEVIAEYKTDINGEIEIELPYNEYLVKEKDKSYEYQISIKDFIDYIDIHFFEEVYNAKLKINIYDVSTNEYLDTSVTINDKKYYSSEGIIITDILSEGVYNILESKIDGYIEVNDIEINIDKNSKFVKDDENVYIIVDIYNEKEKKELEEKVVNNELEKVPSIILEESDIQSPTIPPKNTILNEIFELPNLGIYE